MLFSVVCLQLPFSEYLFSTDSAVEPHAVLFHHVVLVRDPAEDLNVADLTVPQFVVEPVNAEVVRGLERLAAQVTLLVSALVCTAVDGQDVSVDSSLVLLEVGTVGTGEEFLA